MNGRKRLSVAMMALTGAVSGGGCGPAAKPPPPAPARLTERWQDVAIGNSQMCPERLACLVGLSGPREPTIVSIKQVPFTKIRGIDACMPKGLMPGLRSVDITFGMFTYEAVNTEVPTACPALGSNRLPPGVATPYEDWRRSDSRYPLEGQNGLGYSFLPLGGNDTPKGWRVRCVVVYDPSEESGELPKMDLRTAAETCVVLFYFRARG